MSIVEMMMDDHPWHVWRDAAATAPVDAAIRDLYQRLDAAVAARGPTCWQSGNCCHFDEFGHLLYVTGLEIAWFVSQVRHRPSSVRKPKTDAPEPRLPRSELSLPLLSSASASASSSASSSTSSPASSASPHPATLPGTETATSPSACPYQVDGLCSTHVIRPLGCRIFFCQHGTQQWQHELYEQFLQELRMLHNDFDLPYRYVEWRAGLAAGVADQLTAADQATWSGARSRASMPA